MSSHRLILTRQLHTSPLAMSRRGVDPSQMLENEKRGVFRVLDIGLRPPPRLRKTRYEALRVTLPAPSREKVMKTDQDWPSVWPGPRTFHPASVPLPVRQGFADKKGQVVPAKYANVELMKVPNFLHLTPPAIKKQCDAIKKFCTAWPKELNDKDTLNDHFPMTEITSDYLNASSSIRDFRSRVVTIQFEMSSLFLDKKSEQKLHRLIGPQRYDEETDLVTITSDRCPYRKQNSDYCDYLLKALYYESRNREDWEKELLIYDQLDYQPKDENDQVEQNLAKILNEGENPKTLDDYKNAMLNKLKMKNEIPVASS